MQGLSAKGSQGVAGLRSKETRLGPESGAVGGVAPNWMPQMRQVHADLMGAPGFEGAGEHARDRGLGARGDKTIKKLPMGDGGTPIAADCLFVPRLRVTAQRRVDCAFRLSLRAPDDCKIAAPERPMSLFGELLRECTVCAVGLRHDHQAGRVLVEAVHNSRPL